MLGDSAPAGDVASGLPATVLLNLLLTLAGLRARPPPAAAARAGRPHPRGAAPWLEHAQRLPRRFLPRDPRVEEPYLLTPQLALRVAILGFVALAALRRAVPAAVGAAGALGRHVPASRRATTACATLPDRRAARRDPRPQRPRARPQRPGHEPRGLAGRPAEEPRAARRAELQRLATVVGIPVKQLEARIREHADDPLTPVVIRRGIHDDQIVVRPRAPGRSSRASSSQTSYLRKYPHRTLAAHVLGHVGEINAEELKAMKRRGYELGDSIGQAGRRGRPTTRTSAAVDGSQQLTVDSRGRPTSPLAADGEPAAGQHAAAHDRPRPPAGRRAGAAPRASSSRTRAAAPLGGQRRRDRGDRPARRLGARARLVPDLRAVGLRQPRPAQARPAPERRRRGREEPSRPEPRDSTCTYPPGSTWKPVTALAAMQEHILTPYSALPVHARLHSPTARSSRTGRRTRASWISLPTALAESCDTYFYQVGDEFYKLPENRGHRAPELGVALRIRRADRHRRRPRGVRPRADARVARASTSAARTYGEIDRIWKPGYSIQMAIGQGDLDRDAAPDDALLRDARERRPARDAAHRRGRRAGERRPATRRRCSGASRAQPPTSTGVDPAALSIVRTGLYEATHVPDRHLVGRLRHVPRLDRRQDRHRREARHAAGLDRRR